ncbi:MAG: hypothetical protein J6I49_04530 [Bacteroidales bacterium]|nr:hypothetical protein [Bacteroidales bacterium]
MRNTFNKDLFFYLFAIIMTFLLYQRDVGGTETNKFIFLGITVLYALVADYSHLMMATAFLLPLANGLPGNYIFPILCVLIWIKGRKMIHASSIVWVSFALIAVSEIIHIFGFSSQPSIPSYLGYCAAIFLLLVIGGSDVNASDNSKNALAFCIGSAVMLFVILLKFSLMTNVDIYDMESRVGNAGQFYGEERMTLGTNPNNIGLYSIATMTMAFALWYYKKIPIWLFAVLEIVAFVSGVSSFSRTWMLCLVLFGLLYLFLNKGGGRKSSSLVIFILGIVGVYYFFTRYCSSALEMFTDRFSDSSVDTAGARTVLFAEYNKWMFSHGWALLFGTGAQCYKEFTMIFNSTHNALQQIFISYGLPGLFLFLYLLYKSIKKWHVRHEYMVYLPMIVIAFFLQSSQFLNPFYCMFPFIAAYFILKMVKSDSMNNRVNMTNNHTRTLK